MEHANLLGQYRSQTEALQKKEVDLETARVELSSLQVQLTSAKAQLQAAETTSLRHEKKAQTAQQEVELLNSLLVRNLFHVNIPSRYIVTKIA